MTEPEITTEEARIENFRQVLIDTTKGNFGRVAPKVFEDAESFMVLTLQTPWTESGLDWGAQKILEKYLPDEEKHKLFLLAWRLQTLLAGQRQDVGGAETEVNTTENLKAMLLNSYQKAFSLWGYDKQFQTAQEFRRLTKLTPWAEADLPPEARIICNQSLGKTDYQLFTLAWGLQKLLGKDHSHL